MRKNELRKIIADGKTVLNAWLAIANPFSAELMAHQGFDAVTIDLQHGPVDFQAAVGMLAAISTTPAVPMVRVPWNEPILTAKLLECRSRRCARGARPDGTGGRQDLLISHAVIPGRGRIKSRIELGASQRMSACKLCTGASSILAIPPD